MLRRRLFVVLRAFALLAALDAVQLNSKSAALADDQNGGPAAKGGAPGAEASVKRLGESYIQAFNAGDAATMANLWAADSEYIADDGTATKGKAAIVERFKRVLAENKGIKLSVSMKSIRQPVPDVALADGIVEVTGADGDKDSTRFNAVLVRKDGHWLLHTVRDLPGDVDEGASPGLAALKQLEWLVGQWTAGTKDAPIVLTGRWDRNQSFLIQEYSLKQADGEVFSVSQRIGYDPLSSQLKSWTFDSRGGFGEGYWKRNGNTWVVDSAGVLVDGRRGTSRNMWRLSDDDHFEWESRDREVDDVPAPDVTVKFTRKPQTTAAAQPQ